ncbi:hypothetical protein DFH11DRAFT_1823854 [Phellopilus nigrolimitatus]|nr:hypothetical protein DFH11DRAFT_1823854 [Phellopilus nigrolimitatus]
MSFRDPYYPSQPAAHYGGQQPYSDAPDYDPYGARPQQHPTYDQSGYADDEGYPTGGNDNGAGAAREKSRYEDAPFPPALRPPKCVSFFFVNCAFRETGAIRLWRKDHHGQLWTKGGRGKCVMRFCCCTLLIALFLIISIILSLGIWIRPPDITVNNVGFNQTGSAFQVTSSSLNLNLAVNISVDNPNYFAVSFKEIKVDLTYPIDNMDVGGGEKDNIDFHAHTQTTFYFPFTLTYNEAADTDKKVLMDLLTKCGITGGTKEDITVDYKITLGLKILFVTVSPSFSNTFNFACPVTASDLSSLLKGSGIDITGITGAT